MKKTIRVDKEKALALESIFTQGAETMSRLTGLIEGNVLKNLDLEVLARSIENDFPEKYAYQALTQAVGLRRYVIESNASREELLTGLLSGLQKFGWNNEKIETFKPALSAFENLIFSDYAYLSGKYYELILSSERNLRSAKIYTNIVPLFNESRDEIIANIIMSKLNITYFYEDGKTRMDSIDLSIDKIRALRDECDRALNKISVTGEKFRSIGRMPPIISEDD